MVLHGASGLPEDLVKVHIFSFLFFLGTILNSEQVQECVKIGVRKFNVNTEVRLAYLEALKSGGKDLLDVMENSRAAMESVIIEKFKMFGSAGKAAKQNGV